MKESKNYPLYEVTPVNSIRELLDIAEAEVPEKIAFKYRVKDDIIKEIKYAEFIRDVNAVGSALCELGVIGEHIAQIGENSYRWINVYLTVLAGNGVYIPVDKDLPDGDIINILKHSDPFCSIQASLTTLFKSTPRRSLPIFTTSSVYATTKKKRTRYPNILGQIRASFRLKS